MLFEDDTLFDWKPMEKLELFLAKAIQVVIFEIAIECNSSSFIHHALQSFELEARPSIESRIAVVDAIEY